MSDLEQLARESRCSIELTRNAKGSYQWVIKHYHDDGDEELALKAVRWVDEQLRAQYPDKGED